MMIRFAIILLFLLFFKGSSYGQVRLVDNSSGLPIAAMNIFNPDGLLIGTTNADGRIELLTAHVNKEEYNNYIFTDHIAYTPTPFFVDNFIANQVYLVNPIMKNISEVMIQRPSLSKDEVIVLTCYYRSFDTYDRANRYYSDGIMNYYIPQSGSKPKYALLEYRVFLDDSVHYQFKKATGNFLSVNFLPEISFKSLAARLSELDIDEDTNFRYIRKEDAIVGHLKEYGTNLEFYWDKVTPDSVLSSHLFGFKLKIYEEKLYEIYQLKPQLERINVYDLDRISETIVSAIRRGNKMEEKSYEASNQLYVISRKVIPLTEYKAIQKNVLKNLSRMPETSNFKARFWEYLDVFDIPDIPNQEQWRGKLKLIMP